MKNCKNENRASTQQREAVKCQCTLYMLCVKCVRVCDYVFYTLCVCQTYFHHYAHTRIKKANKHTTIHIYIYKLHIRSQYILTPLRSSADYDLIFQLHYIFYYYMFCSVSISLAIFHTPVCCAFVFPIHNLDVCTSYKLNEKINFSGIFQVIIQ